MFAGFLGSTTTTTVHGIQYIAYILKHGGGDYGGGDGDVGGGDGDDGDSDKREEGR